MHTIDPVCFYIGTRPIYWFGVLMALAFLAGMTHWTLLARKLGRDSTTAGDLALWLMVGGILGARIAYVLSNMDYFLQAPREIIRIDQGGLVFYGGFAGAVTALALLAARRKEPFLALADFSVSALPLGHAFGRVGCFLNGCCHGATIDSPCFCTFGLPQYPVQLYEAAYNLLVYVLLLAVALRRDTPRRMPHGTLLALYLIAYPAGRFMLEFLRGDDRIRFGNLDIAQYASIGLMIFGLLLWTLLLRRHATNTSRTS